MAGLFPEGSLGPGSRALPAIWANKADFDARANAFGDASARLAELAKAGDAGGCNGCDGLYRAPQAKP